MSTPATDDNLPIPAASSMVAIEEMSLKDSEKRLKLLEARRELVLRTLNVTDVAKLGEALAKNKFAAEKLHEVFGGRFELLKDDRGKPLSDIQVLQDDDVGEVRIYTYFGRYERPDGKVVEQMGSFSTKDPFFAKAHEQWKTISEINIVDVMVAAQTECYKKNIFRGCGLGDWYGDEKQKLLSDARGHDFSGSQAGSGAKAAIIGFGNGKGKSPTELNDKDLAWYTNAYTENVKNPAKKKFKDENQLVLTACLEEQARRKGGAPPPETQSEEAPADAKTRGAKLTALNKRLQAITKTIGRVTVADLLQAAAQEEVTTVSDLTDAELDRLLAVPEDDLMATATSISEA